MATKQGIGIWKHYRTTDRADGLESCGAVGTTPYRAKLYWGATNWRDYDHSDKRPYMVVWFTVDGLEMRAAGYVSDEVRPRRNYEALRKVGANVGLEEIAGFIDRKLWLHEQYLSRGCTYENDTYYYPDGSDWQEIERQISEAWALRGMPDAA